MALQPGTTLGPYAVTAKIGEGGMGEVYRARDTKLDRDVALKVLPQAFTDDPDRLARFEREAKVLASLNHPIIGHIYGLEEAEGQKALVLELVEGPTLADRIKQGPIPVDEALPIAKQIAEALEAAHEAGVIHRDLKPANIKVKDDGTVKVLDFGLAKALDTASEGDPSQSPTLTAAGTQMGVIMGTAAYMSPEQARGAVTDHRADIWSFGVVLYEVLSGRPLFAGSTVSDTLASVLKAEPDWTSLPGGTSASIRKLLRRCLAKDRKSRLQHIGDARVEIDEALSAPWAESAETQRVPQSGSWRRNVAWLAAVAVVVGLASGLTVWRAMRSESPGVVRFGISLDEAVALRISITSPDVAISPNGEYVAYLTGSAGLGAEQQRVRPLDQLSSETLVAEGVLNSPFFSPDSQSVGFYDRSTSPPVLKRVSVEGGPASAICELQGDLRGASWRADGTIVFASANASSGLWRVAAVGGEPEQLTTPDGEQGELDHLWPEILPASEAVLFTIATTDDSQIAVLSLDTLEQSVLIRGGSYPRYSPTGHLLYVAQGDLWAVRFDLSRMETAGDPVPVQQGVLTKPLGAADLGVSDNGSLIYIPADTAAAARGLVWVNRDGEEEPLAVEPGPYATPRVSPDGTRVAVDRFDSANTDVWVYDLARQTLRRLTTDSASDNYPLWTLDSERLVFQSNREGIVGLYWQAADGTGSIDRLMESRGTDLIGPGGWSPDGGSLVFDEVLPGAIYGVGVLSMEGDRPSELLLPTEYSDRAPTLSPDGRWMAYFTNETGRDEVYVQRFPDMGEKQQISVGGGREPLWSPNGRELFYRSPRGLMVVPIDTEPRFLAGAPAVMFERPYALFRQRRNYDISPDGERFLMIKEGATDSTGVGPEVVVVLNWTEELKRLVPVD